MEILKFSEPPKRSSRTRTQKRGGLMPLLAVVVSVAVLGGMSTTLAGTITLNSAGSVEFGQGVVTTAACDTTIRILPTSNFDTSTSTFNVSTISIRDIGTNGGVDTATAGGGCLGKYMTLKAYNASGAQLDLLGASSTPLVKFRIPTTVSAANNNADAAWSPSSPILVASAATFGSTTGTNGDGLAGQISLTGFKISGTVTKITLESSDS